MIIELQETHGSSPLLPPSFSSSGSEKELRKYRDKKSSRPVNVGLPVTLPQSFRDVSPVPTESDFISFF